MNKKGFIITIVLMLLLLFTTAEAAVDIKKGRSYILRFSVSGTGNARICASEGYFAIDMQFFDDRVEYKSIDGTEKYELSTGKYMLVNSSGCVDVYYNGKLAFSYIAPYEKAQNNVTVTQSGMEITDISVEYPAQKSDYLRLEMTGTNITKSNVSIEKNYDLEFDKTGTGTDNIKVYDGTYVLSVQIGSKISVLSGMNGETEYLATTEVLGNTPLGEHYYRLSISYGICQLFIDNKYFGSFRMPKSNASGQVSRHIATAGTTTFLAIKRVEDCYFYETDFKTESEFDDSAYWSKEIINGCTYTYLNGIAKNPRMKARILVDETSTGGIHVLLRYTNEAAKVIVGYNFENGTWEIRSSDATETVNLRTDGKIPVGEWIDIELIANNENVRMLCNDTEVLNGKCSFMISGKTGFCVKDATMQIKNISYCGEGVVIAGLKSMLLDDIHTTDILPLGSGELIMAGSGGAFNVRKSYDNGANWQFSKNDFLGSNMVMTEEGRIVSIKRIEKGENLYIDCAYISDNGGVSFEGPYPIQSTPKDRITMNNKLTVLKNGALVYAANDLPHGEESYGDSKIFYSKDGGKTWQQCLTSISTAVMGINLQEPKVIELPDGTLRCYVRTDTGFLYYIDSIDGGMTWNTTPTRTQFVATCCAFNIERDIYNDQTYYMTWQYDNINTYEAMIQFPRTRVALAVSNDGCESFQYVGDIAEYDSGPDANLFANHGIRVLENEIFVTVIQRMPPHTDGLINSTRVCRIDKSTIKPLARFSALHTFNIR